MDEMVIELPPLMQRFVEQLKGDRKHLMKDKAFEDPKQLRVFVGTYVYPRMINLFEMLAAATMDTYGLAVSNTSQVQRLHAFTVDELQRVGSDIDGEVPLPGVSTDVMDDFQQSFYALGVVLREKLPDDKAVDDAFNKCAGFIGEMTAELMGDEYVSPSNDAEEDSDEGDDDGESRSKTEEGDAEVDDSDNSSKEPSAEGDDPTAAEGE